MYRQLIMQMHLCLLGILLLALSLLNQTSDLVPQAFYDKITSNTPCYFFGNAGKVSGEFFVDNTDIDYYASYRGKMTNEDGINLFGELLFQPMLFDDDDFYENRTSSLIWGMMRNRKRVGIYLDVDPVVEFISEPNSISGKGSVPWIVVDARNTTFVDSSTYIASGGIAPRQVVAMNNLRFSLTKYSGINYLLETGRFDNLVSVEKKTEEFLNEFILEQNYPNPFNPTTKIKFTIPAAGFISLKVFDFIGRQVAELANGYFGLGTYNVNFDGSGLSSGVYFYQLKTNNYSETKSMISTEMNKYLLLTPLFIMQIYSQQTPLELNNYQKLTSYDELTKFVYQLDSLSDILEVEIIGQSVEGRNLYALKFSNSEFGKDTSKIKVLIFAQQHGNEQSGKEGALLLATNLIKPILVDLLKYFDLVIIPQMNPDGSEINVRSNANGMDLNRNHLILTEPETIALHKLFDEYLFEATMDVHEYYPYTEDLDKLRLY